MFERFTDKARNVVVVAQEEARLLNHNYIGTEHILLGLIRSGDSVAARTLRRLGVSLEEVRTDVLEIVGAGGKAPGGHIPFTPRSKKVLELSLREALQLHHNYIGTEHILLGLLREGEGLAAQILVRRNLDLERVRMTVIEELSRPDSVANHFGPGLVPSHSPAAEDALAIARELAVSGPVGSHHLLEALARSEGSAAGRVLASLGIEPEALAAAIDALDLEATTDLTPVEASARRILLQLQGDEVHIVLTDQPTVELVRTITEQLGGPVQGDNPAIGNLLGLWVAINAELVALQLRVTVPTEADDDTATGLAGIVRRALHSRLQRRHPGAANS
jgi:ATP-dependent Clp protease ATP-binding subunit ClpA